MKHKLTYLILLLCCGGMLYSQTYFSRVHRNWESYSQLLALDSGYVTVVQDYELPKNGLIIREYDLLGDVVDSAYYLFNEAPESIPNCLFKIPAGSNFIYASALGLKSLLVKFNRQWDTVQTRIYRYQDSLGAQPYKIIPDTDSTFLMTGRAFNPATQRTGLLLTRMDTSFNVIWETQFQDTSSLPGGYIGFDILPVNDGYLLGGACFYAVGQYPNRGVIVKTDLNGNFIWQREITSPKGTGAVQLGKRSDGNFFFFAPESIDTNYNSFSRPSRIRFGVFDDQGTILKDKYISKIMDRVGLSAYQKLPDGNYITGGGTNGKIGVTSHLFKFNEDGDSIWQRFYYYGYPEATSVIYNLALTSDSGFIIAGNFTDSQFKLTPFGKLHLYTWLLKLDQYGCDTAGCEQVSLPEVDLPQTRLEVYPNPFNDHVQLRWAEPQEEVNIKAYNSTGQLIDHRIFKNIQDAEITTRSWPAGIYHLKLISRGKEQALSLVKE